jgi:polysaccharide deacetylase 2 family uncharacterized protein YibQ
VAESRGFLIPQQQRDGRSTAVDILSVLASLPHRLVLLSAIPALLISGCGEKSLRKSDLRAITSEIVAAAQQATQHKSEIAIRPESGPKTGHGEPAVDNIYVAVSDSSQVNRLKEALDGIASRRKLSVAETRSGNILHVDFFSKGTRTHTIHIGSPMEARTSPPSQPGREAGPRLAIILDDMGYDRAAADSVFTLPFPITVSVIPNLPLSTEIAEEAYRRGDQVLLHLPMEADGGKREPTELRVGMKSGEVEREVAGMLETVPHAAGVNNHQGSRATADASLMNELMPLLHRRGLFFIDSRTTAATVAYAAAQRAKVPSASRKVFLDDAVSREAVRVQIRLAARDAERNGFAIAIGHPHQATITALAEEIPQLEAHGIRFVFASDVVQ